MSAAPESQIPPSALHHLGRVPEDQPVALLIRHSVRGDIRPGDTGNTLPITEIGRNLALALGRALSGRLRTLHTSPVIRCVQTAEALREGAGFDHGIILDRHLGDPGVYVLDDKTAWQNWERYGHAGVIERLVSSSEAMPGMARPNEAARLLLLHILSIADRSPGLHVFVTHDLIVAATVARLLDEPLVTGDWPSYLEGAFFWRAEDGLHISYRGAATIRNVSGS